MIVLASTLALYQLPAAIAAIVSGLILLTIGLTGILFGWHRDDSEGPPDSKSQAG